MAQQLLVVAILVAGYVWYTRSQELFRIIVRGGKPALARGYVPPGLLHQIGDAVSQIERGEIRAHKTQRAARLSFRGGIDERTAQRLRNLFGLYPMAQLRAPHVDGRRVVSDAFTLSWLFSLLRQLFR